MIASDFNLPDQHAESRHILIVDDEVDAVHPLNRALILKGLRVTHAFNGNEGLAIIENDPPDLVLLDIMLPGRSGLLLLEAIRERTDFTAPIVMVSGIDADRHRDYALTLGAADYVTKPYAMSRMVRLVELLLNPKQGAPDGA
jgi:DNA-binding response OmpR family regulator